MCGYWIEGEKGRKNKSDGDGEGSIDGYRANEKTR
jgi:hypothetical protein